MEKVEQKKCLHFVTQTCINRSKHLYAKLWRICTLISAASGPAGIYHTGQLCLQELKITGKLTRFGIIY